MQKLICYQELEMPKLTRHTFQLSKIMFVVCVVALTASEIQAQSGSRGNSRGSSQRTQQRRAPQQRQRTQQGSQQRSQQTQQQREQQAAQQAAAANQRRMEQIAASNQTALGMEGYCPVCVLSIKKWAKGSANHQVVYDGVTYFFPDANVKQTFVDNPAKFVPALGGDCTVCYANANKRMPGNIRFASIYRERLFLFPSAKEKAAFEAAPASFVDTDLAHNGNCIVCTVKAGKEVAGDVKFTAVHEGFRYLFPSDEERQMFVASPGEFVSALTGAAPSQAMMKEKGSETDEMMKVSDTSVVSIQGKTGCAGCDHGVSPIGAPEELGLSVTSVDGTIYVIEDSHDRWPELYKARFEGKQVSVTGEVVKSEGNIHWIKPTMLKMS